MKIIITLFMISVLLPNTKQESKNVHFSKNNIPYVWSIHFIKGEKKTAYSISENINDYDFPLKFVPDAILIKFKDGCICSKIENNKKYKAIKEISIEKMENSNKIFLRCTFSTNIYAMHPEGYSDANMIIGTGEFNEISSNCECQ